MLTPRWLLALPLALAATLGTGRAATVRDQAGMFSPSAVRQAEAELNRVEREYQVPITIQTIDSLGGQSVGAAARRYAAQTGTAGLFVLIAGKDNQIDVISERSYRRALNEARLRTIQNAFLPGFKDGD